MFNFTIDDLGTATLVSDDVHYTCATMSLINLSNIVTIANAYVDGSGLPVRASASFYENHGAKRSTMDLGPV